MSAAAYGLLQERDFAAAVLGGGQGKRLGMSKILLEIGGRTVLDHIIDCLRDVFPSILLVLKKGNQVPAMSATPGVEVIPDALPSNGPLVGIYTALQNSPAPYVFVMACDMPYPNMDLVRGMLREAAGREAVVPRMNGHLEPLFAVYRRDLLEKVRAFLDEDRLKIPDLIAELDVRYFEKDEISSYDPDFRSFFNVNTLEDLRSAQDMWGLMQKERPGAIAARG